MAAVSLKFRSTPGFLYSKNPITGGNTYSPGRLLRFQFHLDVGVSGMLRCAPLIPNQFPSSWSKVGQCYEGNLQRRHRRSFHTLLTLSVLGPTSLLILLTTFWFASSNLSSVMHLFFSLSNYKKLLLKFDLNHQNKITMVES